MSDEEHSFLETFEAIDKVDLDATARVATCVREWIKLQHDVESLRKGADALEIRVKQLEEQVIPDLMLEAGVSELRLDSGERLSIQAQVYASIEDGKAPDAYAWLDHEGHGDLLKHEFKLDFKRDEQDQAEETRKILDSTGRTYSERAFIHPSTLRAFVQSELDAGHVLPEAFKVTIIQRAKLSSK